jgi:4-amino-4-deoxychorismate lyase
MVKVYSSNDTYNYPFPAVTLAYFLRYPNPYATHVLSTDTIARSYDPETQRLTTIRLHLKRSKLPTAFLNHLPRSLLGANSGGDTQAYILEKSVVDVREGWMDTESRNLEWTGVLSVIERQVFRRPGVTTAPGFDTPTTDKQEEIGVWKGMEGAARRHGFISDVPGDKILSNCGEKTEVKSSVTLHSHIGEKWKKRRENATIEEPEKVGFFKSWSTASLQRSVEIIGLKRAQRSQPNAKEGMKVVLERMREGGLVGVLEGMRRDRDMILGGQSHAFKKGNAKGDEEE